MFAIENLTLNIQIKIENIKKKSQRYTDNAKKRSKSLFHKYFIFRKYQNLMSV